MITPNLWVTLVTGIIFLVLVFTLNRLLFRPLWRVVDERRERTVGLREAADELLERFEASFEDYNRQVKEERQRGYRLSEEHRRLAVEQRNERLTQARQEAEGVRNQAKAELEAELESSRRALQEEAESISALITARVLDRPAEG